jgi:predicted metalloprotease with PDZ domain
MLRPSLRGFIVLLAAAVAGGCASAPGSREAPPRGDESSLVYRLELVDPDLPRVRIGVAVQGDADGMSEFELENWGGIEDAGSELELAFAREADGAALEAHRARSGLWIVHHEPRAPLWIAFDLAPTERRATSEPQSYYRPILEPGLLHLIGTNALPAPRHVEPSQARAIRLEWRGFERAGWRTLSSFAPDGGDRTFIEALDAFRQALFLAGELHVLERDVRGKRVTISVYGDDWGTSLEDFADLCREIVRLERAFFDDFEHPTYLISLIPVGERSPAVEHMGGTGLTDSFALFLPPGAHLDPREDEGMSIPWLLAHEMFHEWNGHLIRPAQPERLSYWFSEGFTDFYARRLLYRGGFLSPEEYVASWNRRFAEYAGNPERNAPASRIDEAFWSDANVGSLPYQRGDVVALFVDHAIAAATGGRASLDDLMLDLARRARRGEPAFDVERLLDAIAGFAGPEAAEAVRRVVVDGATLELPLDLVEPGLALEPVEIRAFDLGFDFDASQSARVVRGVASGSAAEAAGLRDGMPVRGLSFFFGRADVPVEVRVVEGDVERTISYLPQGRPVASYRFALLRRSAEPASATP